MLTLTYFLAKQTFQILREHSYLRMPKAVSQERHVTPQNSASGNSSEGVQK